MVFDDRFMPCVFRHIAARSYAVVDRPVDAPLPVRSAVMERHVDDGPPNDLRGHRARASFGVGFARPGRRDRKRLQRQQPSADAMAGRHRAEDRWLLSKANHGVEMPP
ncbi:hypothetical protein D8S82_11480 [Mycobacterium hodleri]|uniref:Uncharacterized protein n=1 Tax=Mycolicibacterium hodleri TaxID=49897 RepID=A0A544W2L7_9MYCO|nr:hypothetical protein [Mycolicibacterium hodleri]TQR86473.1 hypothetical protein D8S82_11480 [Mycolicibacterium hodleri]